MKFIDPYVLVPEIDRELILKKLERRGRLCYKSEDMIGDGSAGPFIERIMGRNHASVIEHIKLGVIAVTDRGVTHEWVRHRVDSNYSQESTRYCNYGNDRFGNELTFIKPHDLNEAQFKAMEYGLKAAEVSYFNMLALGCAPQQARRVLPNQLKTEIAASHGLREWAESVFPLRCGVGAHPDIQRLMIPTLLYFKDCLPEIFEKVPYNKDFPKEKYAAIVVDNLL